MSLHLHCRSDRMSDIRTIAVHSLSSSAVPADDSRPYARNDVEKFENSDGAVVGCETGVRYLPYGQELPPRLCPG